MNKQSMHYGLFIAFMVVGIAFLITNVIIGVYNYRFKQIGDSYWSGSEPEEQQKTHNTILDRTLITSATFSACGVLIAGIKYLLESTQRKRTKSRNSLSLSDRDIVIFRNDSIDVNKLSPGTP